MAWTAGVNRSTGDIVTAAQWNNYLGAGGSLDTLFDGTRIESALVTEYSINFGNAPTDGKVAAARSADTGGMRWQSLTPGMMLMGGE